MVVIVVLMVPDDFQDPGIGQSFIIFALSAIKKTRDPRRDGLKDKPSFRVAIRN